MKESTKITLITLTAVLLVFANFISANIISLFGASITCSVFVYPLTFLFVLLLSRFFGKREAIKCVCLAACVQTLIFLISIFICNLAPISDASEASNALRLILTPASTRGFFYPAIDLMLGTLVSFIVAQLVSIHLYGILETRSPRFVAAVAAFFFGLVVDSVLFIVATSFGTNGATGLGTALFTQIISRLIIAIILAAIFYYATYNSYWVQSTSRSSSSKRSR